MSRLLKPVVVALLAAAAAHAQSAPAAAPLAAAIMARLAALPDRVAGFTAEKQLSSLTAPIESAGRLVFRHPAHLEKHTISPRAEDVIIDAGRISIATPGSAPREAALAAHPALLAMAGTIGAVLGGDLSWLQQFYVVEARGSLAAWKIELRPRAAELAHVISHIELAGTGADLRNFALLQPNGDSDIMTIQPGR